MSVLTVKQFEDTVDYAPEAHIKAKDAYRHLYDRYQLALRVVEAARKATQSIYVLECFLKRIEEYSSTKLDGSIEIDLRLNEYWHENILKSIERTELIEVELDDALRQFDEEVEK